MNMRKIPDAVPSDTFRDILSRIANKRCIDISAYRENAVSRIVQPEIMPQTRIYRNGR